MRVMLELPNDPDLREAYRAALSGPSTGMAGLRLRLSRAIDLGGIPFAIVSLPSLTRSFQPSRRHAELLGTAPRSAEERLPPLVFSLEVEEPAALERLVAAARAVQGARAGIDLPIAAFDSWCPGQDRPPLFHTREAALALIGAPALAAHAPPLRGEDVNVVVVDLGLNPSALAAFAPGVNLVGAWAVPQGGLPEWRGAPGDPPFDGHGAMVARNLLSLAPAARLFDFPLLPDRVNDVVGWTSWAQAALNEVRADIKGLLAPLFPGPWVLCNAWGVYDRRQEGVPPDDPANYTGNPEHPLNALVADLDSVAGYDQVFAAGNGGQFCPHPLCGPGDTGPGNSILGANSHGAVLTVGAVRADGMWIGYSSQGPGQPGFREAGASFSAKPDLCAPSHFAEAGDAAALSTGTSAACGLVAGAVAALRGAGSPCAALSPAGLREHLRSHASRPPDAAAGFDLRYGRGILNL
ncbi:S8 family serine peptidase [Roseomonas sp. GCM10028921]